MFFLKLYISPVWAACGLSYIALSSIPVEAFLECRTFSRLLVLTYYLLSCFKSPSAILFRSRELRCYGPDFPRPHPTASLFLCLSTMFHAFSIILARDSIDFSTLMLLCTFSNSERTCLLSFCLASFIFFIRCIPLTKNF